MQHWKCSVNPLHSPAHTNAAFFLTCCRRFDEFLLCIANGVGTRSLREVSRFFHSYSFSRARRAGGAVKKSSINSCRHRCCYASGSSILCPHSHAHNFHDTNRLYSVRISSTFPICFMRLNIYSLCVFVCLIWFFVCVWVEPYLEGECFRISSVKEK